MNVLIVEPDGALRARRVAAFVEAGHAVTAALHAEKALSLLRRAPFDLLLVDPFCEREDNFSILAATRMTAPKCRIVLLTATSMFAAGELFTILPRSIEILRAPMPDRDLIIYCEEPRQRLTA